MTKFLNISVDDTLGGDSPSDETVSSQKALKTYIDAHSGGLPSQSGQSGKFLTTNGTSASWANTPTEIPSQSGNSGKFLTTNGASVSWGDALTNTATGLDCLTIASSNTSTGVSSTAIGVGADTSSYNHCTAIGTAAGAINTRATAIGKSAKAKKTNTVAVGDYTNNNAQRSVLVGSGASTTGAGSVTIGNKATNTENLTFKVALNDTDYNATDESSGLYTILNSSGKIPDARLNNPIPSQSGNSGKFLTTNGSSVSWATVDALPSQSGQTGKFLTTNGTNASWATATKVTIRRYS